jgi:hypothetical protein
MVYHFLSKSLREGKSELIPFLFAGKVALEDIPVLYEFHQEGVIQFPKYLPPQMLNLHNSKIESTFSTFKKRMKVESIKKEKMRLKKAAA